MNQHKCSIPAKIFIILLLAIAYCSDKTPYNPDTTPCNPDATDDAKAVLTYLAKLSADEKDGTIVGQNCGHGDEISTPGALTGYYRQVEDLYTQTGNYVGIVGMDYEHDEIYTPARLHNANQVLIDHWNNGGLVEINWAPHNPWLNDESDIENNSGYWTDSRTYDEDGNYNLADVDLNKLTDPSSAIFPVWRKKLDRVAAALAELRDAGVVVIWRPLQEMNGNWFWWGHSTYNDPKTFKDLYRDMYNYFTHTKNLDNLLWVYSTCASRNKWGGFPSPDSIKPVEWCYPGDDYVDIVAGTVYNDELIITDYIIYRSFNKVLGVGEYGASLDGVHEKNGTFDNLRYINTLEKKYPEMSFWITWHTWASGIEDYPYAYHAIIDNLNANGLMNHPLTITRDRIDH